MSPFLRIAQWPLSERRALYHRLRKLADAGMTTSMLESAAHAIVGETSVRLMETR